MLGVRGQHAVATQAVRALIEHLLTAREEQLGRWRSQIQLALGESGQALLQAHVQIVHAQPTPLTGRTDETLVKSDVGTQIIVDAL